MNWRDEIQQLQKVPREEFEGMVLIRLYDLPKHARGWFVHWLDAQGKSWLEDAETGERIAKASDYDEWMMGMLMRYRNAEFHAQDIDRDE